MALQQLNLKLPPAVIAYWRSEAAAQGLSVRDWLVGQLTPEAARPLPGSRAELADRVARLEEAVAALQGDVTHLRQTPPVRVPRPRSQSPSPPAAPAPALTGGLPPGAIETARLAELLTMKRGTLNERIRRAGGAREGLELNGYRCIGLAAPERGGPPRALWVPAGS